MKTANHLTQSQLAELKNLLLTNLRDLPKLIAALDAQDPFKDTDHALDNADDADVRQQLEHEEIEAELKTLQHKLSETEAALLRMDEGTYGIDAHSGDPIPFERLKVVPETRHTIETERRLVK